MDLVEASNTSSDESSYSDKRFVCSFPDCSKQFSKNRKLINHLRLHQNERPFACDVPDCNKKYTNSSHLRRHKKKSHEGITEKVVCMFDGCERELASICSLKKHILRCHTQERVYPFTCTECHQGFHKKRQLQQHCYIHTGELPFSCDVCKAKFLTTTERNRHKRNHKRYTCECGHVCDRWNVLRAHKKTCKLSLKCQTCNKEFSTKSNLKMHQVTHVDKDERRIFMCSYDNCSRHYFYEHNLTAHINSIHKKILQPKIPCTYEGCSKLLNRKRQLEAHLKTHEETNVLRKPRKDKNVPKKTFLDKLFGTNCLKSKDVEKEPELNCKQVASRTDRPEGIDPEILLN